MRYAIAVVGLPVIVWATSLGCGLAIERPLRVRLDNAVVLALGLCTAIVLVFPWYSFDAGDMPSIVMLLVVTVLGLVFAQGGLRNRLNSGWPGVAGLGTYVLYMLSVIVHGDWTWVGYNFVNDTGTQFLLVDHLQAYGTDLGHLALSTQEEFLRSYLGGAYPLGTHAHLATLSGLLRTPVEVIYQGYLAALAAVAAVALATAAGGLLSARLAALVGFGAVSANLTYQYAMQGNIKEIGMMATLCVAIAAARAAVATRRPLPGAVILAIPLAAILAVYNAAGAPYMGAFALILGIAMLVDRGLPTRRWLAPVILGAGLTAVLALPALGSLQTFYQVSHSVAARGAASSSSLGQLLRALPLSQISGVWLDGDYRQPVVSEPAATLTVIATVAILVALISGLIRALWSREIGLLLMGGIVGLVLLIVYPRVTPYADGKLLAIGSPAIFLLAGVGIGILRGWARPLGLALIAALTLAIVVSDVLAYYDDRIAPADRMAAVGQVGDRFAGRGEVLFNEFEEYAKYFARHSTINVPFETLTPQQVVLRQPTSFYGHYFDLDLETLPFVESFPVVVTRRGPAISRPPANYRLVYENHWYNGWMRMPRPLVLAHMPLQQMFSASSVVACRMLAMLVQNAPAGARLIVARAPETQSFGVPAARDRSIGWLPDPLLPDTIDPTTGGHASGVLTVAGGRYGVWVQGDFPRRVTVQVDGRTAGSVSGINTPGQWEQGASLKLAQGPHVVRIVKAPGRRHLAPGDGGIGEIGPVTLRLEAQDRLQVLPVSRYRSVCGTQADWVELVRL